MTDPKKSGLSLWLFSTIMVLHLFVIVSLVDYMAK